MKLQTAFPLTIVAAILLSACAIQNIDTDAGSTAAAQAAIAADSKAWSFIPVPGNFIGVTIDSIDGKQLGSGTSKISVNPGGHKIRVTCRANGAENSQELSVDAVAGANYHLAAVVGGNRPVPCTSIVEQKSKSGRWENVPAAE